MTNLEKYEQAFCESLEITKDQLVGLEYQQIVNWDSVGHMGLIAAIEDADLSSVAESISTARKKLKKLL